MNNKRLAFTLIELLVVIAIVGILSGLIIVGMSSSVNSARIARAQIFSASLRDSLLMNLISEWKFDDASGSTAVDSWSGTNNATLSDTRGACSGTYCPQWQTACMYGGCLSFDGSNQYVNVSDNTSTRLSSVTVSMWIKGNAGNKVLSKRNNYSFYFLGLTSQIPYMGIGSDPSYDTLPWTTTLDNTTWHLLAMTFDSSTKLGKLYVDAASISKTMGYNIGDLTGRPVIIGAESSSGATIQNFFNGSIDDVRIYNAAMPASHIKEQYYAGLNRLLENKGITKGDYSDKLFQIDGNYARM